VERTNNRADSIIWPYLTLLQNFLAANLRLDAQLIRMRLHQRWQDISDLFKAASFSSALKPSFKKERPFS
jgi:hypothetical protein